MMNPTTEQLPPVRSVLICSDDPIARYALVNRLRNAGNDVRSADSPGSVLMAMHVKMPDLVVLHPGPKFSGPILYQRLRTHRKTREVPVLVVAPVSALDGFVTRPEPGMFASKPVKLDVLASRVQRLLQILPLAHGRELTLNAA